MDVLSLLVIFLATVVVLNVIGIALSITFFFKAKKLVEFSKKGLKVESALKEGVNEYTEKVILDWLSKIMLSYKDELEKGAKDHFEKMDRAIEEQVLSLSSFTASQEDAVSRQVSVLVAEAKEEIEKYKKNRIKNIDEAIGDMVEKVSREVLNRTIKIEEHEGLVWEALESAKNGGIFEVDSKKVTEKAALGDQAGERNG